MVALTYMAAVITTIVLVQARARETAGLIAGLLLAGAVGLFAIGVGIAYPIACCIAMWRSWRLSTEEMRRQIRWPLMSIALALGIAVLLSLLSIGLSFVTGTAPPPWLFSVFEISTWVAYSVIPLAFAAAVLRYGLMDIRFIIRLTFFYLLTTASVYIGTFAVVLLLATAVGEAADSNRVTTILITLLAVSLFEPLRRRVQRRVDKHFYQRTPDPVGVLARHGQELRTMSHRDDLERRLVLALQEAIPHGPTYVFRRREDQPEFLAAHSPDPTAREAFAALPFLTQRAPDLLGPTVLAEMTMAMDEARVWEQLGIEALLPGASGRRHPRRPRARPQAIRRGVAGAGHGDPVLAGGADVDGHRRHRGAPARCLDEGSLRQPARAVAAAIAAARRVLDRGCLAPGAGRRRRLLRCVVAVDRRDRDLRRRRRGQGARRVARDGQPAGHGQGAGRS